MKQVKVLIAHSEKDVKEEIRNNIKNIEYVEIVDEVTTGKEVLDRILKYEPDIVFTKYDMKDISIVDVIEMTGRVLQEKCPLVKFISSNLSKTINANYEIEDDIGNILGFETEVHIRELGTDEIVKTIQKYHTEKIRDI